MKKTVKMLAVVLALMLGLCCSAQAITQSEVEGVWDVDLKPVFAAQLGIPEDQVDMVLEMIGGMTMTIEFTADKKMIMETITAGEVGREEYDYLLIGDTMMLNDGSSSTLTRSGDTLILLDPDGTELILTKHVDAAETLAGSADIVGVWNLDINFVLQMSGASEEEMAEVKPFLSLMSATMEFTADGRCILLATMLGEELTREETTYTLHGNILEMNGGPAEYVIQGDTLTIVEDGVEMVLTRRN